MVLGYFCQSLNIEPLDARGAVTSIYKEACIWLFFFFFDRMGFTKNMLIYDTL